MTPMRYRIGCAGMFELGMDYGHDGPLEAAILEAHAGPVGCEVLDIATGKWMGPYCMEDVEDAAARLGVEVPRRV